MISLLSASYKKRDGVQQCTRYMPSWIKQQLKNCEGPTENLKITTTMRFLKCQLGETANRGSGLVSKFAKHQIRAKSHKLHHSSGLRVMLWKVLLLFHLCKVSIMNQRLITITGTGWQCTCPGELRKFRSWVERSGDTRIGESFHFLSGLWSFSIFMFL